MAMGSRVQVSCIRLKGNRPIWPVSAYLAGNFSSAPAIRAASLSSWTVPAMPHSAYTRRFRNTKSPVNKPTPVNILPNDPKALAHVESCTGYGPQIETLRHRPPHRGLASAAKLANAHPLRERQCGHGLNEPGPKPATDFRNVCEEICSGPEFGFRSESRVAVGSGRRSLMGDRRNSSRATHPVSLHGVSEPRLRP